MKKLKSFFEQAIGGRSSLGGSKPPAHPGQPYAATGENPSAQKQPNAAQPATPQGKAPDNPGQVAPEQKQSMGRGILGAAAKSEVIKNQLIKMVAAAIQSAQAKGGAQ